MHEFTAGEYFQAKDKQETRSEGREEAKAYRYFLDNFRGKVINQLQKIVKMEEIDLNTTTRKIKDILGDEGNEFIKTNISMSLEVTKRAVNDSVKNIDFNTLILLEMTPAEFWNHINELEESLIKD